MDVHQNHPRYKTVKCLNGDDCANHFNFLEGREERDCSYWHAGDNVSENSIHCRHGDKCVFHNCKFFHSSDYPTGQHIHDETRSYGTRWNVSNKQTIKKAHFLLKTPQQTLWNPQTIAMIVSLTQISGVVVQVSGNKIQVTQSTTNEDDITSQDFTGKSFTASLLDE